MNRVSIREGNTGILRVRREDGLEERYVPNYDLAAARELLLAWQDLRDGTGRRLKDNYRVEGINWFPTVVNYAHGRVFANYVKYQPLVDRVLDGELEPNFENEGEFARLLSLLQGRVDRRSMKAAAFNALVSLNNRLVARRSHAHILFFRFTPDDFRTVAAKQALDDLGATYVEALGAQTHLLLASLRRGGDRYFYGRTVAKNVFGKRYEHEGLAAPVSVLFALTTEWLETKMSTFIAEYRAHTRDLRTARFKTFYGIDDTQTILPLLYACQDQKIDTVAHQHGAAYHRWHASYMMEGLRPEEIRWFDKLIVWDEYWRERFSALSNLRPHGGVVVGGDLFGDQFRATETESPVGTHRPRAILVPYEFLTNTYQVGLYVTKLLRLGYDVWFKPRSDEKLEDQLDAYCLPPDSLDRLKIVRRLTREFIDGIDVVAGTMSTLVYQLIPFRKAVWLLETDYPCYLDHLADEGYIHRIRYEDLDKLEERHFAPSTRDLQPLSCARALKDTLARHVLGAANEHGLGEEPAA